MTRVSPPGNDANSGKTGRSLRRSPGTLDRPTLKQVAQLAGVAPMTASYILNGIGKAHLFRPDTQQRVREAAEQLRYRPNAGAKGIRSGRFGALGILISERKLWLSNQLLSSVSQRTQDLQLNLLLNRVDLSLDKVQVLPPLLRQISCDGLIVNFPFSHAGDELHRMLADYLPTVWINTREAHDAVYTDESAVGRMAVEHLVQLGHRRIAYLQYWMSAEDHHYSMRDRRAGYLDAMSSAGLAPVLCMRSNEKQTPAEWLTQVKRLLSDKERPTAAICYGVFELDVLSPLAAGLGLGVPQDISIVVPSDSLYWRLQQTYTTINQRMDEVGRESVEMLMRKIAEPRKRQKSIAVAPTLELGDSSSPPRS